MIGLAKNLVSDKKAVSYLILVGILLSLGAFSIVWMYVHDLIDIVYPIYGTIKSDGGVATDDWNDWGLDALVYMFTMLIILAPLGILWWAYQKAQKPQDPYG